MKIGFAEKNGFRDQVWRDRSFYGHMLPDPRCSFSLLVWVCFLDTNGLKVNQCQVLEQFLLTSIWDVECINLFKKRFSQFVNILWVNMFNTITTSNQMSFQVPRLWEKCVTRSTPEGFEQCWRSKCDCCSVKTWHSFLTFDYFFDRAHQLVLHLQNQCHKGLRLRCKMPSTFGLPFRWIPWNFETSRYSLLLRKSLKIFEVTSSSFLLPCKCRANALNKQRLSL